MTAVESAPKTYKHPGNRPCCACCATCHQTFTVPLAFDKHRTGSHANDTRHCVDPATVGLVDTRRAYPCWGLPDRRPP